MQFCPDQNTCILGILEALYGGFYVLLEDRKCNHSEYLKRKKKKMVYFQLS